MKDESFSLLMFMAMKRSGNVKAKGCTNGSCQRVCSDEHENSSPTLYFALSNVSALFFQEKVEM